MAVGSAVKPCAFGAPLARLRGLTAPPRQAGGPPCREGRRVPPSRPLVLTRSINVRHIKSWSLHMNAVDILWIGVSPAQDNGLTQGGTRLGIGNGERELSGDGAG